MSTEPYRIVKNTFEYPSASYTRDTALFYSDMEYNDKVFAEIVEPFAKLHKCRYARQSWSIALSDEDRVALTLMLPTNIKMIDSSWNDIKIGEMGRRRG